jgi:hypothetical protein
VAKLVTTEDVEAERNEVEALRAQVAQAENDRRVALDSHSNTVELARLRAEKELLKLELQRTQAATDAQKDVASVAAPLSAAQDAMAAAVAGQKAETALAKADAKAAADNKNEGA